VDRYGACSEGLAENECNVFTLYDPVTVIPAPAGFARQLSIAGEAGPGIHGDATRRHGPSLSRG
jgi:hypothetical protein